MTEADGFHSTLEEALPRLNNRFSLVHIRTVSQKCRRLVFVPKKRSKSVPMDTKSTHFFVLSYDELDVFALETILFESATSMTLFISKADTTGHYYEDLPLSIMDVTTALIREIIRYYGKPSKPLRICLFAKSDRQYLFPLSSENPKKHVLPDAMLVKWWLRTLDPLHDEFNSIRKAKLQIPGSDTTAIEAFFPKESNMPWQVGDIFWEDIENNNKTKKGAVFCIPRFPDDPKGRFLDYLVLEKRAKKTSREQFFLELQSRQEFRLGSVVGIIGMEGNVKDNGTTALVTSDPPCMSYKKFEDLKNCIMGWDYSTKDAARQASCELLMRAPHSSVIEIEGKRQKPVERKRSLEPNTNVNLLGGLLVRKKRKT
jgi:regulator of Ty1 transposition protein 109